MQQYYLHNWHVFTESLGKVVFTALNIVHQSLTVSPYFLCQHLCKAGNTALLSQSRCLWSSSNVAPTACTLNELCNL
jgi:hypothetical protein